MKPNMKIFDSMKTDGQYGDFVQKMRRGTERIPAGDDFSKKVMERIGREAGALGAGNDACASRGYGAGSVLRGWKVVISGVTSVAAALLLFGILSVSGPWNSVSEKERQEHTVLTAQDIPVVTPEERIEIYRQQRVATQLLAVRSR